MPERTQGGNVVLWARSTGQRIERWPVDARGMIESGEYTDTPPGEEAAEGGDPVPQEIAPLTVSSTEHPLGGPLKVVQSADAAPAIPFAAPKGRRSRGKA